MRIELAILLWGYAPSALAIDPVDGLNQVMRFRTVLGVVCAFFVVCGFSAESEQPLRLRILSYNIHHGEGTDGRLDLERIAKVIRDSEADLIALQEVDDRATRTGSVPQTAELGKLSSRVARFGQAMSLQGGGYGQAILSRWPIQTTAIHSLPQRSGREPRIAFETRIAAGPRAREILFITTHLDHEFEAIRLEQARELASVLRTNTLPMIVAGDFNAGADSGTLGVFGTNWVDSARSNPQPTIPAELPTRRIDFILLHPTNAWKVIETRVLDEAIASDHRPVLATVELK